MAYETFHLKVGSEPWCDWSASPAGQSIHDEVAAATKVNVTCGHIHREDAERHAKALETHFGPGKVHVCMGECPSLRRAVYRRIRRGTPID